MDKVSCVAIDDDPDQLRAIEKAVGQSEYLQLCCCFTDLTAALAYINVHDIQLVLSDVELRGEILSYDFLDEVPKRTAVILITAHSKYFLKGFLKMKQAGNLIACVPKPVIKTTIEEIEQAYASFVKIGMEQCNKVLISECSTLTLSRDYEHSRMVKICYSDIIMILPSRTPRGVQVFSLCSPRPLYYIGVSLNECFAELESNSPNAFILIGRNGIVNKNNVVLNQQFFESKTPHYAHKKLRLKVPKRIEDQIRNVIE